MTNISVPRSIQHLMKPLHFSSSAELLDAELLRRIIPNLLSRQ